jgi:hypothetical protein
MWEMFLIIPILGMSMIGREASNKYQLFICILFYKFNVVYFIATKD